MSICIVQGSVTLCSKQHSGCKRASFQSWLEAVSVKPFSYFCKNKKCAYFTGVHHAPRGQTNKGSSNAQPLLVFSKAPILEYKLIQITFY